MRGRLFDHLNTTGAALKNWLIAQAYDAVAVGLTWLVGLLLIGVPLAWLWAILAFGFQFIPWLGPVLTLVGPAIAAAWAGGWPMFLWVLGLYALITVVDAFVYQPYFLKRTARVPIWAAIVTPIVLGLLFSVWGIILAPPLLAVIYAFRLKARASRPQP